MRNFSGAMVERSYFRSKRIVPLEDAVPTLGLRRCYRSDRLGRREEHTMDEVLKRGSKLAAVVLVTVLVVGSAPALAQQVPVTMVDCVIGGACIGTTGNDTINGSSEQDEIYGLEGDDT